MKKVGLFLVVLLMTLGSALATCELDVSLLNQDPYPAVPGDYVDLVFTVSGVASTDCGDITLELLENYPLSFDPTFEPVQTLKAGTFLRGYSSDWIVPYKVRIDAEALDGNSEIEVIYSTKGSTSFKHSEMFNVSLEEVRAEFDVFVRSYDYTTKKLTLEVLNTAKNDVQALVITIPSQNQITVFGGNKNVVGDIDSNDYTSTDFEAVPSEGNFDILIDYTDKIGERRVIEETVSFEAEYFEHTKPDNSSKVISYIIWIVVIGGIAFWLIKRKKKKSYR